MENMPIITLEVMQDSALPETGIDESFYNEIQPKVEADALETTGMHFLTEKCEETTEQDNSEALRIRNDLLEYTLRSNGSVICKLCGKVLASRSHWYRHKYKAHVHNVNPAPVPLFQCHECSIYFKSRKGYIGHISSRHSETLQDASPVLTNAQAEALAKEKEKEASSLQTEVKKEPDLEMSIPKSIVPTYQAPKQTKSNETSSKKSLRCRDQPTNDKDWEEKRSREEKLVSDIIARVRRECEATGPGPARQSNMAPPKKRGRDFGWCEEDMEDALEELRNGQLSENAAALKYNIPRQTLRNRIRAGRVVVKKVVKKPWYLD